MGKKREKAKDALKAITGTIAGEIIWHYAGPTINKLKSDKTWTRFTSELTDDSFFEKPK